MKRPIQTETGRVSSRRQLRAVFKEIARSIVSDDRSARKHGWSQNTIGAIENALVRAHEMGRQSALFHSAGLPETSDVLSWIEIPPRSRLTLIGMSFCFNKTYETLAEDPSKIECFDKSGRVRWRNVNRWGVSDHSVADGSVRPLIRLGLLTSSHTRPDLYELTSQGIALCREYWDRRFNGDSTLPLESVAA